MMPLKLIERVLPWLVGSLTEDEAREFLENMQLAGSTSISYVASTKMIKQKKFTMYISSDISSLIQLQQQMQL